MMVFGLINWFQKGSLGRPSIPKSAFGSLAGYTEMFRQFCDTSRNSINGVSHICSAISSLLLKRSPSAIIRRIAQRVINPLNGLARWPFAHITQKKFKGLPPLADPYSPTSVILVIGGFGVVASCPHRSPRPIGGTDTAYKGVSVGNFGHGIGSFNVVLSGGFPAVTGTRCDCILC